MSAIERLREAWERAVEKEKHADAVKALRELEQLEPKEPNWSHRLGDAYRRMNKNLDAAAAFERAMDRYHAQGFLPRAIAMAKLAASLDPVRAKLVDRLTPESAKAAAPALPPTPPLKAPPLSRAKDEKADEVRFDDDPMPSSISFVIEDVDIESVREPMPTIPDTHVRPPPVPERRLDHVAAMAGFRLFADLDRDALVELAQASEVVEFIPGAMVVMRDEPAYALYAIVEGTARVEVKGASAVRLAVGDVFGEGCLLDDGRRGANVRAESSLTTLRIGKTALDAIVQKFPAVQDVLFQMLARRLVSNVLATNALFAAFEPSQRLELAQMFEIRRAVPGAVLAEAGRKIDGLYVLLAGELMAKGQGDDKRIARGSTFGQASLALGAPSDVKLEAATELVVLRLPSSKFASLAALYPPALAHLAETATEPLKTSVAPEPPANPTKPSPS